jgi:hypothetical protein
MNTIARFGPDFFEPRGCIGVTQTQGSRMMTTGFFRLLLFWFLVWLPAYAAEVPRQLTWEDLIVALPPARNPFAGLSVEQLDMLTDVGAFRDRKARGEKLLPQEAEIERAAVAKLEKMGIAIDALLAKRDETSKQLRDQESVANPSLDGKLVRMPGFLLPVEFTGNRVTEFLLVPWVGACIHTPPPSPNQIVYVKADKPYEMKGTFDPVWVTGRMSAGANQKSVYITDGSAEIGSSYSMRASEVDPYR